MFLKEIAEIQSGHLFKSKFENEKNGNITVIQNRDVDEHGNLSFNNSYKVRLNNVKNNSLLKKGDILFKAKSRKPIAAVVNEDVNNVIATNHFFILKIKDKYILPEFLAWYINQDPAQKYIKMHAGGTRIPIVNKKILGELEVPIPNIKTQIEMIKIHKLSIKEKKLIENIMKKRKKMIDAILINSIKNER